MRRPGTRFVREVKDSSKDTVLFPFEYSVDDAFIIESGALYHRFYKNRANLQAFSGGPPVEVVTPYLESEQRRIHFTQSADVLFQFHVNHRQRRLSRVSDTDWSSSPIVYVPPPSFEVDTDISQGATLMLGALTGTNVVVTASGAVFLEADVNRQIVVGASRAIITAFGASSGDTTSPNTKVRVTVLDDFLTLGPIATGDWVLRLSPQATLDPDKKEPVGGKVTLTAAIPAFRAVDLGKFITIYGGLVKITTVSSSTIVVGEILAVMADTTLADPGAAAAGAWTLEEASWDGINGFPRTGEFFEGRLAQASTLAQPTTWWLSASDDFDKYAVGGAASDAVDYTIASRKVNQIQWLADNEKLFIGTGGAIFTAEGGKSDAPIGGDTIPLVKRIATEGCAPVQPVLVNKTLLFLDRSLEKIFAVAFDLASDGFSPIEVTGAAEHILAGGARLGPIAVTLRPDPRIYFVRNDGTLVTLTFFQNEKVIGFTRLVTKGAFEAVAAIPQPGGAPDQVWVIVARTVGGQTRRYVEFFEVQATDAVAGPDTTLESTGNGQTWLKGAANAAFVATAAPVFISDTTVFMFRRNYGGGGNLCPRYQTSLDGGATFAGDQAVTGEGVADASNDVLAAEVVVDPADLLPEHLVFILLMNDASKAVWSSRTVLQPNPALATWSKVDLPGSAPLSLGVRVGQACVMSQDSGGKLRLYTSSDFAATFPNVVTFVGDSIAGQIGKQFVASPGTDTWVVLNVTTGNVYRTVDNGVSWAVVQTLTGTGTAGHGCLLNVDDTVMIAVYRATIFRSADAGQTWVEVAAGFDIIALGYFGTGIIGGLVDGTFTAAGGGTIEARSEDAGLTWGTVPVDAGLSLGSNRYISPMAVRGPRALVVGSKFDGGGVATHWYCPSTVISTGPGESIKFADRPWTALYTDSAVVQVTAEPTTVVTGLSHLEGRTVDVVADGAFRGTAVVAFGSITLALPAQKVEVGLHYDSTLVTMRPAIEGTVIEGLPRSWDKLFLRLLDSIGGTVNGAPIQYDPGALGVMELFTGDRPVIGQGWDLEGRITVVQSEPYPLTLLSIFGTLSVGDHD